MDFKTLYDKVYNHDNNIVNSVSGNRFHDTYSISLDTSGRRFLKKKGCIDVYAEIQSHADSVDIHKIIDRFNNGDLSVLDNGTGYYCDITQMPKTYAEMIQRLQDAESYFRSLPVDVRAKFNHDVSQFLSSAGGILDGSVGRDNAVINPVQTEGPYDQGSANTTKGDIS